MSSLLAALTHAEWLVRLHAVEALGKTKLPEAVDPLLSVLFNDRDRAVREDAVRAVGAQESRIVGHAGAREGWSRWMTQAHRRVTRARRPKPTSPRTVSAHEEAAETRPGGEEEQARLR